MPMIGATPGWNKKMLRKGAKFGDLRVGRFMGPNRHGALSWECHCICGNTKIVSGGNLRGPTGTRSCGCRRARMLREGITKTHGMKKTSEWQAWQGAKMRCHSPRHVGYPNYGGRGLVVCDGWRRDFPAFFAALGHRPSASHSLDRIDPNLGYVCGRCDQCEANGWPMNCRWLGNREQQRNRRSHRRIAFRGEELPLAAWAERVGMDPERVRQRLENGWSVGRALTEPVRAFCYGNVACRMGGRRKNTVCVKTPEMRALASMKQRCHNPKNRSYPNYGGRGIVVCDRWRARGGFKRFLADMGPKPSPLHSLDRIDVNGPYSPENCRWATPQEQASNKRSTRTITFRRMRRTVSGWAAYCGVSPRTMKWRLRNWPLHLALTTKRGAVLDRAVNHG